MYNSLLTFICFQHAPAGRLNICYYHTENATHPKRQSSFHMYLQVQYLVLIKSSIILLVISNLYKLVTNRHTARYKVSR